MKFSQPLEDVTLIKRYKRFLADVSRDKGEIFTVHCPNTGSMKNCWGEGWKAWILDSENPKRKYRYTWVMTENQQGQKIGINTHLANQLAVEALEAGKIEQFADFQSLRREVRYGEENSKIDILLKDVNGSKIFIEVKSVTLLESDSIGYFPDAVSERGQKHLRELIGCVEQGHRAALLFVVQHEGIKKVAAAEHIDEKYTRLLKEAAERGVEILAYAVKMSPSKFEIDCELPVVIPS
ncbi:DNA/RNA nuclease SfsA [Aliikangiella sp. G2MR2-5]|uniref:DNA/RNA nuclease SfsA n=1 Tax=Aliikangiella sp. G2MR2-5 TaxID=2788943 RepID=UPI0018AB36D1|nr:DNA/RNA nuclease SfsA [Aliikangiella sp. G2MR2-5]